MLSIIGFAFFPAQSVTPQHLATIFEYVHELSFEWKYCEKIYEPTFENFQKNCFRATKSAEAFYKTFGFLREPEQLELLHELFERLKNLILIPDTMVAVSSEPCTAPFWLALNIATEMLIKFNPRQGGPGNSITLLQEDFLYKGSKANMLEFFDLFAKNLALKIEEVNLFAQHKAEKITEKIIKKSAENTTEENEVDANLKKMQPAKILPEETVAAPEEKLA